MNTKLSLTASAIFLGLLGLSFTFAPIEFAGFIVPKTNYPPLFIQILGAIYVGFALVNWTAKGAIIGGIYNKPIALGNFAHFTIGALTLIKIPFKSFTEFPILLIIAIFYITFAIIFGLINFKHPLPQK